MRKLKAQDLRRNYYYTNISQALWYQVSLISIANNNPLVANLVSSKITDRVQDLLDFNIKNQARSQIHDELQKKP